MDDLIKERDWLHSCICVLLESDDRSNEWGDKLQTAFERLIEIDAYMKSRKRKREDD
jgi:hypothetical protein